MSTRFLVAAFSLAAAALAQSARPSDTFKTSAGDLKITPIMHATFLIQAGGKNIYVDPAQGSFDGLPPADLILITDIHGDHMSQPNIDKLHKDATQVFGPKSVAGKIHVDTVIANGETRQWGNFTIEAVAAYNLTRGPSAGQLYHDKGRGNGYVVSFGGKRLYISGDTEGIPEMLALKNIDVAFVCMNLPFTMTPEEAAAAVKAFHPAVVYPYHYRGSDLAKFSAGLQGSAVEVRLREWYPR
ncbi:MAG TPA: MBL fold metallo-hydrolase [Bryobacteraceae bacterium]|nr:MBL fold metallo-hydrolase [Bryobacteraceae bacterium]